MHILILILVGFFIFLLGFSVGFLYRAIFRRISSYVGVMKIIREDDRVLYSLELHENPVILEHMNEVVFKVESSEESS